jgi:hypothetical protein
MISANTPQTSVQYFLEFYKKDGYHNHDTRVHKYDLMYYNLEIQHVLCNPPRIIPSGPVEGKDVHCFLVTVPL